MSDRQEGRDELFYSVGSLKARMDSHEKRLEDMDGKLDKLIDMSSKAQGGWMVFYVIISATVSLLSAKIITVLQKVFT